MVGELGGGSVERCLRDVVLWKGRNATEGVPYRGSQNGIPHSAFIIPHSFNHRRQRLALDQPHGVEVNAALATYAVDVDDVRVSELRGGDGFVLEALQMPRVEHGGEGKDF